MLKAAKKSALWGKAWIGGVSTLCLPTRMIISDDLIQLQAFFGTYYIPDDSIISITRLSRKKVSITHAIREYPSRIIFSAKGAYREIEKRNFHLIATAESVRHIRSDGGPIKLWVHIVVPIFFGIPLFSTSYSAPFGVLIGCYIIMFISCLCLLNSKALQKLVLKPDRTISEIVKELKFAIFAAITSVPVLFILGYVCETSGLFCPE